MRNEIMSEGIKKTKTLLQHWIHHNTEHKTDFEKWAKKMKQLGSETAYNEITTAAMLMDKVNEHLSNALTALGE